MIVLVELPLSVTVIWYVPVVLAAGVKITELPVIGLVELPAELVKVGVVEAGVSAVITHE